MSLATQDSLAEIRRRFSGDFRTDLATRSLYSTDASIYQLMPLGVALPRNTEELHQLVELAAGLGLPILPRGSGSSLAGQAIGEALILDGSRHLDAILSVDRDSKTATVEPGVVLATLNRAAAKYGLQFGPDPASAERATLGGVIGNNATGAHSILYGMAADHLLSAEVILSDGSLATFQPVRNARAAQLAAQETREGGFYRAALQVREKYSEAIKNNYPQSWRNSAGYRLNYLLPWSATRPPQWGGEVYPPLSADELSLAPLLAGSEGTLAVIRRATVRLVEKPKHTVLAVVPYDSIAAACDDVPRLLAFRPSAVELIPRMLIRLARGVPAYARQVDFVDGDPEALLVVEFAGDAPALLEKQAAGVARNIRVVVDKAGQARVWNVRKVGLGIFDSRPASARPIAFIEDCAIPVGRLGEFVRAMQGILREHQTEAAFYAHASGGCLHIRPLIDLRSGQGLRQLRGIAEATVALTLQLGGAMSSEHGDGLARAEWLRQTYGESVVEAVRLIKRAADPQSILNPNKMLEAPPMDANLRFGANYSTTAWQPALNFDRAGGLAAAIEQCNGQGVCRKEDGVMCPSFQATREEMHSTRGRANLLRMMISHGGTGLAPEQVKPALELCLACKGCSAECPSGVDMPRLKVEFFHEYYRSHRHPLRDYLFGYINPLAELVHRLGLGGLANAVLDSRPAKMALSGMGISPNRSLALFGRPARKTHSAEPANFYESALYLPDTFTRIFEPQVEQAARQVLAACGVRILEIPVLGAGRTLLSKSFLPAARRHAAALLDAIAALDPRGELPVLGCEPSELYLLRDELQDLLPERRAEITALAARAWLVEEFLVRPDGQGEKRLSRLTRKVTTKQKIALHGHCAQKAQPPAADGFAVGQAASAEVLQALGYQVEVIPSGCCGMSGAFGYEAEKYDLSMQIGGLVLFPAVRQALGESALVCAPGTSCRSQIMDGTGAAAVHPLVLLAQGLE